METIPVTEVVDYTQQLDELIAYSSQIADASVLVAGFMLFFVVVLLCYFVYKFFRIFF